MPKPENKEEEDALNLRAVFVAFVSLHGDSLYLCPHRPNGHGCERERCSSNHCVSASVSPTAAVDLSPEYLPCRCEQIPIYSICDRNGARLVQLAIDPDRMRTPKGETAKLKHSFIVLCTEYRF